jgi:hypothetical protein
MPSKNTKKENTKFDNVKAFVLFLMRNVNYPLSFVTVNDIVMQTDYILYIDLAEAFPEMVEDGLIRKDGEDEHGEPLYTVTRRGAIIAEELSRGLLPNVLDEALRCALQYLDLKRRGVTLDCYSSRLTDGTYDVTLILKEGKKTLLQTTVNVDSEYRSQQIREAFRDHPDVMYRGVMAMLTGKMNFLIDKYKN